MQTELHVQRLGQGERVVFLHGSTYRAGTMWEPQLSLADRYELVIPDRRGWGASPPGAVDDLDVQVEELTALLGDGAHLVGFSYGAMLALLIAGRTPERIRSLILHEPPVFHIAHGHEEIDAQLDSLNHAHAIAPNGDPAEFIFRFLAATGAPQSSPGELGHAQRVTALRMMQEPNPVSVEIPIGNILRATFPKLVISGRSLPSFIVLCQSLAQQIDAKIIEIDGASHGVRHPGVTEAIGQFLDSVHQTP